MNTSTLEEGYCGEGLKEFRGELIKVYGTIATVICSLGLIANTVNIFVFSSKSMKHCNINIILLGISVADLLYLISHMLHTVLNYGVLNVNNCEAHTYNFQTLSHISNWTYVNFHCISVTLTLLLAFWRYIGVAYPLRFRQFFTVKKTIVAVLMCYVMIPIGNTMCYMLYDVGQGNTTNTEKLLPTIVSDIDGNNSNCPIYDLRDSEYSKLGNGTFREIALWLLGISFQVLPSVMLIVFSIIFARVLFISSKENLKLTNNVDMNSNIKKSSLKATKMVLVISVYFLITDLAQGILLILGAALGRKFHDSCYRYSVEIHDLLVMVNNSSNLIIYITMSKPFRSSLKDLLKQKTVKDGVNVMT
ncbi:hypothetical protein CHUAL_011121 [Chamberlinius hualienensis]